ncbi:hypothetical protein [uncultured Duncaniella sp.]|uniref:hypothetical protein n=1 Tax=uncultured Duncaniella sp. TaxID=2768039 RepID=UPI00262EC36C|nr:hypothetical protein [uncultured Duncaniella sp.]
MAAVTHEVRRIIAVDFDDCLCQSHWPECGPPIWTTINAVKAEQAKGSAIILWTCRNGKALQDAIEWCRQYGIEFDAVNEQIPEQLALYASVPGVFDPDPRKIHASEYWDDRAVRMPKSSTGSDEKHILKKIHCKRILCKKIIRHKRRRSR